MSMSVPSIDVTMTAPRTRAVDAVLDDVGEGVGRDGDDGQDDVGGDVLQRAATSAGHRPSSWAGLTGNTAPVADAVTLRHSASPTDPGSSLAPTTAIVRGSRRRAIGPRVGALLASLDGVEELLGVVEREVEVDDTALEASLDGPPGPAEHGEHRPVVGEDLGGEAHDAVGAGDRREVLEQERGDALALVGVVDLNAASASSRPAQRS